MNIAKRIFLAPAAALALATAVPTLAAHHEGEHGDAPNIVEIAAGNEDFSTLVAALKAADLVNTLAGEGPFTVFAPTNAAFDALPDGTVESLLEPENKTQLSAVLTYHVVPGAVYAGDVVELSSATTVQGGDVSITTEDGRVMIDGAEVIKTDIEADNGVIHVIDAVLLPSK